MSAPIPLRTASPPLISPLSHHDEVLQHWLLLLSFFLHLHRFLLVLLSLCLCVCVLCEMLHRYCDKLPAVKCFIKYSCAYFSFSLHLFSLLSAPASGDCFYIYRLLDIIVFRITSSHFWCIIFAVCMSAVLYVSAVHPAGSSFPMEYNMFSYQHMK